MANMTGTIHSFMASVAKKDWIIDTGATNHMISDLDMLHSVRKADSLSSKIVQMPNG